MLPNKDVDIIVCFCVTEFCSVTFFFFKFLLCACGGRALDDASKTVTTPIPAYHKRRLTGGCYSSFVVVVTTLIIAHAVKSTYHYNPGVDVVEGICNVLIVPDFSVFDNGGLLRSDVYNQKSQSRQVTLNATQAIPFSGLHTSDGTSLRTDHRDEERHI